MGLISRLVISVIGKEGRRGRVVRVTQLWNRKPSEGREFEPGFGRPNTENSLPTQQ